jgi:hypothetical protein
MTYLEAIKGRLGYPLSDNSFILVLTGRGLTDSTTYVVGQAFDLAYADSIVILLTTPDVSEGGYSVRFSDRTILLKLAAGIYTKYGVDNPLSSLKPTATFVQKW